MKLSIKMPEIVKRYVLLDRDGTVIEECHYLSDPDQVEIVPGGVEALHQLQSLGLGLVLVTNQSGLGRGLFDHDQLTRVHERLVGLLARSGVILDGIYFCPHVPDDHCNCRKPNTGMALRAARDLGFVPGDGFVVGDREGDIEMGSNLGATTFLVRTGYGADVEAADKLKPDYVVDSLRDIVPIIAGVMTR